MASNSGWDAQTGWQKPDNSGSTLYSEKKNPSAYGMRQAQLESQIGDILPKTNYHYMKPTGKKDFIPKND